MLVIFLLTIYLLSLLFLFYKKEKSQLCLYNSTFDSFFIKNNSVFRCKFPSKKIQKEHSINENDCITQNENSWRMCSLEEQTMQTKCKENLLWQDLEGSLYICRGPNVLPIKYDLKELNIESIKHGFQPRIECIEKPSTNNIKNFRPFGRDTLCTTGIITKSNLDYNTIKMLPH